MAGYTYIWEFLVAPDKQREFTEHYRPDGSWAVLFAMAPGYIETLLLHDRNDPARFVTVDRWESDAAFLAFKRDFAEEYADMDRQYEGLTLSERFLGEYRE